MTAQDGIDQARRHRRLRRVVVGGALAAAVAAAPVAGIASADPAKPAGSEAPQAPTMSGDQALSVIAQAYDTGTGGGQVSNLIHDVMKLRAQGFKPSNGNAKALAAALQRRPDQKPLIEALTATLAYQRKLQAQSAMAASQPAQVNAGLLPPGPAAGQDPSNPTNQGILTGPTINLPVG